MSLVDVDPKRLAESGKRLVLLDVDNTLLPWRSESIPDSTIQWVAEALRNGLRLCILSNTRHPDRLARIAEKLGIQFLRGKFKPSPHMFRRALDQFQVSSEQAVMIGDQLFTDVWGANRAGIEAIWIRPMTGRDFLGTKVSRFGERLIRPAIYRGLDRDNPGREEADSEGSFGSFRGILRFPVVRQFVKFGIVGFGSFVIDAGLHYLLMFGVNVGDRQLGDVLGEWLLREFPGVFGFARLPSAAAFPVLKVLTAGLAILNSFYWNRRWTFRIRDKEERLKQLRRVAILSIIGIGLNALIASSLNNVIPGHAKRSWAVGTVVATILVAFWNFSGQKYWAFRRKAP